MLIHAINLDRDTERWERFQRRNGGRVDVVRFPAVDGRTVDRAALAGEGFLIEPCSRTDGALGCACSHIALWFLAVDTGQTLTIVEDDTVLAADFGAAAQRLLDELPAGWQMVLWGWNFDRLLWAEIPERVSLCRLAFDQDEMRLNIDAFWTGGGDPSHSAVRVRHAFGSHAYTITPAGAQAMLDACLPMTDRLVAFTCDGVVVDNFTKDSDMNRVFPAIRAYACLPPLALSENRHETSHTVRR